MAMTTIWFVGLIGVLMVKLCTGSFIWQWRLSDLLDRLGISWLNCVPVLSYGNGDSIWFVVRPGLLKELRYAYLVWPYIGNITVSISKYGSASPRSFFFGVKCQQALYQRRSFSSYFKLLFNLGSWFFLFLRLCVCTWFRTRSHLTAYIGEIP